LRGLDAAKALNRLAALNALDRLDQVSPLKSVGLHPLKGGRKGQWAMTVNGPWRLCFRFRDGHAFDVEIVDYH
jgi:proteic killer suppression protein